MNATFWSIYSKFIPNLKEFSNTNNLLIFFLCFVVTYIFLNWRSRNKYKLPPGPIGLPFFGYEPFIGDDIFIAFDQLKKKYGNVFSLYLGQNLTVVLCDIKSVKEAFSLPATACREPEIYGFFVDGLGLSSLNGKEWLEQKRFCMMSLKDLGLGKSTWETQLQDEVKEFVGTIRAYKGAPIKIPDLLFFSVANNIVTLLLGETFPMDEDTKKTLDDSINTAFKIFTQVSLIGYRRRFYDFISKLGAPVYAEAYKNFKALNTFVRKGINKRKTLPLKEKSDESFVDQYLQKIEDNKDRDEKSYFTDRNLVGNIQGLLAGATEPISATLEWIFLAMAAFPDIQEKVHKEIDSVLGKDGQTHWAERNQFPYTLAVIYESFRWRTLAALSPAKYTLEDTSFANYDIPKGTYIILNLWSLHNDENYWKNPEEFIPERFLDENNKILKPESYIPFSYGRRNCPGELVAMIETFIYFTMMIQAFQVLPPEGCKPNLSGRMGLTYTAVDQKLRYVPRE